MRILVTGAGGFIGSHLVERLLEIGATVVGLDCFDDFYDPAIKRENLSSALEQSEFRLIDGDIRDEEMLRREMPNAVDCIVHLAARPGVRPSIEQPLLYQDVNVRGSQVLLEYAREMGVGRFVFGSSSSVYGNSSDVPFSEDDSVGRPISPYAATKRQGELLCHVYHHLFGLGVVALRFFTVYGPRQRPDLAIHRFTRLLSEGHPYEIVNLGESETVELSRLIDLIADELGVTADIEQLPPQPGDVEQTFADISKARRLLAYDPRVRIEEGIGRFVRLRRWTQWEFWPRWLFYPRWAAMSTSATSGRVNSTGGRSPRASISRTRVPDRKTRSSGDEGEVFSVAICSVSRHQKACSKFKGRIPSWSGSIRSKMRWAS